MTIETYYNGRLLDTDLYMTESQWKSKHRKMLKKLITRKLNRLKRKIKNVISAAILSVAFIYFIAIIEYLVNAL